MIGEGASSLFRTFFKGKRVRIGSGINLVSIRTRETIEEQKGYLKNLMVNKKISFEIFSYLVRFISCLVIGTLKIISLSFIDVIFGVSIVHP